MSGSKLNIHYMYLIPLLILQITATALIASVMSVSDYALYTLYLTTINLFYILTLGIPDGYVLLNRKKNKNEISGVQKLLSSYVKIFLVFMAIGLLVIKVLGLNILFNYALVAACITGLYQLTQAIFRALNEAHKQNIYLLCTRSTFVLDGLVYLYTGNLYITLIFDIVCRLMIVIATVINIAIDYHNNDREGLAITDYTHVGFIIMISNTVFNMSLMIDKYALANDLESLGIYSLAITVVLMLRVMLAPLNQVILISINNNIDKSKITRQMITVCIITFFLLIPALLVGKALIVHLVFLNKYLPAIPVIAITMLMMPLMVPVESIIINLNKITNGRLFLLKSIIVACVYALILFSYTSGGSVDLNVYSLLVVLSYFIAFIVFSFKVLTNRQILKLALIYLLLASTYLLICFKFIV